MSLLFKSLQRTLKSHHIKPIQLRRFGNNQQYQRFNTVNKTKFGIDSRLLILGGGGLLGVYYYVHLEPVPISGRMRFINMSLEAEEKLSIQAYEQVLSEYGHKLVDKNHRVSRYVQEVAERIINVSGLDLKWEVNVIHDKIPNAFVLPGGKIFVFTGILEVADNKDALGIILGHEVAHQIARHSAEKMSFNQLVYLGTFLISLITDPSFLFNKYFLELGIFLPFSRKCEIEADEIGLILASRACFNPKEALRVWERMSQLDGMFGKLSFLSTHPSSEYRLKNLNQMMPKALLHYENSDCHTTYAPFLQATKQFGYPKW
ncbi:hypothetical protein K502DRAFT_328809 [Neoconidiobolus thromboides FSU 785]|nr:hypothetical protein K502DRAFT_328809 [Neoconidiobolus thromboides FSU 785]